MADDPVQAIYESIRLEALQNQQPASFLLERVRQYGMAGLFPGAEDDFPFLLYVQSVPRPAWSGPRDFHRETLCQVYEFLTQEARHQASSPPCQGLQPEGAKTAVRSPVDQNRRERIGEFTEEWYSGAGLNSSGPGSEVQSGGRMLTSGRDRLPRRAGLDRAKITASDRWVSSSDAAPTEIRAGRLRAAGVRTAEDSSRVLQSISIPRAERAETFP